MNDQLIKLKYGMIQEITPEVWERKNFDLSSTVEFFTKNLLFKLTYEELAHIEQDELKEVSFISPLNWWEHFKHDVLKMKSTKTKTETKCVTFRLCTVYPNCDMPFNTNGAYLNKRTISSDDFDFKGEK